MVPKEKRMTHTWTAEERALLEKYVTSVDANVFAVKNMPGMTGAAYARYSRAKGGFREVLMNEFLKDGAIDPVHADKLIERVLIAYGDDSVGELEGAHVSFENISILATKEIEDRRIGGSPIEQSTRYVFYDAKTDEGHWRYYRGESLLGAPYAEEYVQTMDLIFSTYAELVEPMKQYFAGLKPIEDAEYDINGDGIKEKLVDLVDEKQRKAFQLTYTTDLRTKACDTLRALLPLSTLTNVGMFGNGRFYQHTLSHLLTTSMPECHIIAAQATEALNQVIPQYVRRAKRNEYLKGRVVAMQRLAADARLTSERASGERVDLLPEEHEKVSMLAAMLYPYSSVPLSEIRTYIAGLTAEQHDVILQAYVGERVTRRDRPGRALEDGYRYSFDLVTNFGVYKDLMRHRMNTQQRQLFTTRIGFDMPQELIDAGFENKAMQCVQAADALWKLISATDPYSAQYAVLHGHFVRWNMGLNDRALQHLVELRTTPQGHPQYRKVAYRMYQSVVQAYPWKQAFYQFADGNDYYWSRADSEARQRVKEQQLEDRESTSKN